MKWGAILAGIGDMDYKIVKRSAADDCVYVTIGYNSLLCLRRLKNNPGEGCR